MGLITLKKYPNAVLANIDSQVLEQHNIKNVIEFEHSGSIPEITGNFCDGVLLKVERDNFLKAQDVLQENPTNTLKKDILHFKSNTIYKGTFFSDSEIDKSSETIRSSSIIFEFFLYIFIPISLGYYIDTHVQKETPFATLVGMILGFGTGIYKLFLFSKEKK